MLENYYFRAVNLNKNADTNNYKYLGFGVAFKRKGSYLIGNKIGRHVLIFGVDMSSSSYVDNNKQDI